MPSQQAADIVNAPYVPAQPVYTDQMSLYAPQENRRAHVYERPPHGAKRPRGDMPALAEAPAPAARTAAPRKAKRDEPLAADMSTRASRSALPEGRVRLEPGAPPAFPRAAPARQAQRRPRPEPDSTRDFEVRRGTPKRKQKPIPAKGLAPGYDKYRERDSAGRIAARGVGRFFGVVGMVVAAVLVLAFGAITVVCKGPFPVAKELFVVSVTETSAVKFLSRIYFSKAEVEKILEENAVQAPEEVTDTTVAFEPPADETVAQDIEVLEVNGPTFVGKMMIVHDPSRVHLATLPAFGKDVVGKRVEDFVADSGAVAGINAGGFADDGGVGKGGQPLGLMIHDGQIVSGGPGTQCNVVGLTFDNQLVVGVMTGADAIAMGVRDAVFFEPTLIVNGTPVEITGTGGGVNPRTAIGQRADGAILLLVIDGRQPHSVGATLEDVMKVMLDHGAVNASNLDGGSSSVMVYQGETINVCASLYGSRAQPAAFVVQ